MPAPPLPSPLPLPPSVPPPLLLPSPPSVLTYDLPDFDTRASSTPTFLLLSLSPPSCTRVTLFPATSFFVAELEMSSAVSSLSPSPLLPPSLPPPAPPLSCSEPSRPTPPFLPPPSPSPPSTVLPPIPHPFAVPLLWTAPPPSPSPLPSFLVRGWVFRVLRRPIAGVSPPPTRRTYSPLPARVAPADPCSRAPSPLSRAATGLSSCRPHPHEPAPRPSLPSPCGDVGTPLLHVGPRTPAASRRENADHPLPASD